jgi:adenine-specific DNA-methyltransferase
LILEGKNLCYKRYLDDYPVADVKNVWIDTGGGALVHEKLYVVQTATKVIERCILMTTDPGDLVLDPTCGSGTTAYVAEQWGRRWIMIDTSRVATSLTLQRILTATYDYYKLKDKSEGVAGGFVNKTVPRITLRSIAQNSGLDQIFAKHEPILEEKLEILNRALAEVTPEVRTELLAKLAAKEKREGKRAVTAADRRRWELPKTEWQEWEVPFDTDPDWPEVLQEALTDYREAWRGKRDEVDACIAASSQGEELVDQPEVDRKKLRVSGPFTVEAVQPAEKSLDVDSPIGGEPAEASDTFESDSEEPEPGNAEAYLDQMVRLLRKDGVRFPDNRTMRFAPLDPLEGEVLHAEGSWAEGSSENNDAEPNVAVAFGPQHGSVTAMQVEQCLRTANQHGYNTLVFAGFSFDGAAQAVIQDDPNPRVRVHMAHVNPDVAMGDLLKEPHSSQLFSVFGRPRTVLEPTDDGEYVARMEGVDIYDPVENETYAAQADRVAAWFLDTDYDGRTFCITQAFFPDKKAWDKIARALKSVIDPERFEKFSGTESLPFPVGKHACAAVKVIDPRGNEVMRVHNLSTREN